MGFPIMTLQSLMEYNDTLFNGILLPEGANQETLVDTICMEYGQMQLLYPDWDTMRRAAKSWFNRKAVTFDHLWTDYQASYNPLYNKDAYYEEERTPDLKEVRTPDLTEVRTPDLTVERTPDLTTELEHGHVATESGQREQQLQGFNSASYANVAKDLPGGVLTNSGTDTTTESGSDTTTQTGTDTTTHTGTETTEHTGKETIKRREYGNIGVTTSTQMLRDDVSFWSAFSWYDIVAKAFAVDFCVMIY